MNPQIKQLAIRAYTDPMALAECLSLIASEAENTHNIFAQAKALYSSLERFQKTKLAECAMKSEGKTQAEKERTALACSMYQNYLNGLNQAEGEYLQAQAQLNSLQIILSCMQSINKSLIESNK